MKKTKQLLSLVLLLVLGIQGVAFGVDKVKPLFSKVNYLPNDTEAEIEANSMKWFEERVKFVKENIKILPDNFMEDWSWEKPLTRMEFLILTIPVKNDEELKLFQNKEPKLYKDIDYSHNNYEQYYTSYEYNIMKGDKIDIKSEKDDTLVYCTENGWLWMLFECNYISNKPIYIFRPSDNINFAEASKAIIESVMTSEASMNSADQLTPPEGSIFRDIIMDVRKKILTGTKESHYFSKVRQYPWYYIYTSVMKEITNNTLEPSDTLDIKDFSNLMFSALIVGSRYNNYDSQSTFYKPNWENIFIDCQKPMPEWPVIEIDKEKDDFYCNK